MTSESDPFIGKRKVETRETRRFAAPIICNSCQLFCYTLHAIAAHRRHSACQFSMFCTCCARCYDRPSTLNEHLNQRGAHLRPPTTIILPSSMASSTSTSADAASADLEFIYTLGTADTVVSSTYTTYTWPQSSASLAPVSSTAPDVPVGLIPSTMMDSDAGEDLHTTMITSNQHRGITISTPLRSTTSTPCLSLLDEDNPLLADTVQAFVAHSQSHLSVVTSMNSSISVSNVITTTCPFRYSDGQLPIDSSGLSTQIVSSHSRPLPTGIRRVSKSHRSTSSSQSAPLTSGQLQTLATTQSPVITPPTLFSQSHKISAEKPPEKPSRGSRRQRPTSERQVASVVTTVSPSVSSSLPGSGHSQASALTATQVSITIPPPSPTRRRSYPSDQPGADVQPIIHRPRFVPLPEEQQQMNMQLWLQVTSQQSYALRLRQLLLLLLYVMSSADNPPPRAGDAVDRQLRRLLSATDVFPADNVDWETIPFNELVARLYDYYVPLVHTVPLFP